MIFIIPLIIGFIIDRMIGDPHSIPHPVVFIGKLISWLENILRKRIRNERTAGVILVVIVITISTSIPFAISFFAYQIHYILYIAVESIMCWQILAAKSLKDESMKVYYSLIKGDIEEARFNVSMIVGRDTSVLDDIGIAKAVVETVAENTSDGVIAPMLYYVIGGAPLAFMYKAINTMDSMIGYKNDIYINLGRCAAKLDDVVNYIPSRLAAILMILACIFTGLDIRNAWKIWRRDKRKHSSPNSAQTESVCAGALNIRLAGNVEGDSEINGMKLLPIDTIFTEQKIRKQVNGKINGLSGVLSSLNEMDYTGYEIHMGIDSNDKAVINNGNVYGTYIHGIFDENDIANEIVTSISRVKNIDTMQLNEFDYRKYKDSQYDKLADIVRDSIDMEYLYDVIFSR